MTMSEFAFYEKEITPPLSCPIPGYFNLRKATDVQDRLYARAAVVRDGKTCAAIISIDACIPDKAIVEGVAARIKEYTGIPRSNVLFGYTHTHTGIPGYDYEGDDREILNSLDGYHSVLINLVADCAILAYMRLQEATPVFGKGEVKGISFCRDFFMKNGTP